MESQGIAAIIEADAPPAVNPWRGEAPLTQGSRRHSLRRQTLFPMTSGHDIHEKRSLRMHRMVAESLRRDPAAVTRFGAENLSRWQLAGVECDDFGIWEKLLSGPTDDIIAVLTGTGEEATRLRQSSPFAGLIPEADRKGIFASMP
jgi:hypothetical protein